MPPRLTRAEQRERTRTELVDAAVRIFAEAGVGATSVEAIAEAAGYSRGAYHSNFGGREELLNAVVARVAGDLGPRLAAILAGKGSAPDRLAAYITHFLSYCEKEPVRTRALVAVVAHRTTASGPSYAAMVDASLTELVALFDEGQRTGEFRVFDSALMAGVLRRALDAEGLRIAEGTAARPVADELVATFTHATRATRATRATPTVPADVQEG